MADAPRDPNSEESWQMARRHSAFLSPIPPSVLYAIQALWKNHCEALVPGEQVGISQESLLAIRRVDKTAKLKAPIYFAATALYPERFQNLKEDDTSSALLEILRPGLFASLLGMVYLHRRLNRICTAPEWETLSKEMVLNMELGFILGSSVSAVGPGLGTLLGGIRYVALATFLLRSPDIYTRYRNRFKRRFDSSHEQNQWGCDHGQISAYLIKDLGFTKDILETSTAFRAGSVQPTREMRLWNAVLRWIDGLKDGKPPGRGDEAFELVEAEDSDLQVLNERVEHLLKHGTSFSWMLRAPDADKGKSEEEA